MGNQLENSFLAGNEHVPSMTKNAVSALINSMCPIWIPVFFLFANEPELGADIVTVHGATFNS